MSLLSIVINDAINKKNAENMYNVFEETANIEIYEKKIFHSSVQN